MELLSRPKPYEDESLRGYIWRLAYRNGYESPTSMVKASVGAGDFYTALRTLLTGSLSEDDCTSILSKCDRCNFRFILRSHFRVCVRCLAEQCYLRECWDYALLPWCCRHGESLTNIGQSPGYALKSISPPIEMGKQHPTSSYAIQLQHQVATRLGFEVKVDEEWPAFVLDLDADGLQRFILLIGAYRKFKNKFQPRKAPIKSDSAVAAKIMVGAYEVLGCWPYSVSNLFDFSKQDEIKSRKLATSIGYLYKAVHKELGQGELKQFVEAVDEHIINNWPDVIDKKSHWLSPLEHECRFESGTEFARRNHISRNKLVRWIEEGKLAGQIRRLDSGRSQISVLKEQDIKAENLGKALSLKDAAEILCLPKTCIRELIALKILAAEKTNDNGIWTIEQDELERFVRCFYKVSESSYDRNLYMSFNRFMRFYSSNICTEAKILKAILEKNIRFAMLDKTHLHVGDSLLVNYEDYRNLILPDGCMSIPDMARKLGVKQEVAYHFANKGFLETMSFGRLGRYVDPNVIKKFEDRYCLLSDMVKVFGTSSKRILTELKALGIYPASGPCVDGGRQYLFYRTDIEPRFL